MRSLTQIEMLRLVLPRFQSDHAGLGRGALPHANGVRAGLQGQGPRSAVLVRSIDPNGTPGRNRDFQLRSFLSLKLGLRFGRVGRPRVGGRSSRFLGSLAQPLVEKLQALATPCDFVVTGLLEELCGALVVLGDSAALLVEGSDISLPGICANPTRTGLYTTLAEMGAALSWRNERIEGGEPVADLAVQASQLSGIEVPADRAPAMIDEYPVLAMAAACADGTTVFHGVAELRHKESDRLAAVATGLAACGVTVEETADSLTIHGAAGRVPGGATIDAVLDHRVAMSFLVLGLASEKPVSVAGAGSIETSFPDFAGAMGKLGADIGPGT